MLEITHPRTSSEIAPVTPISAPMPSAPMKYRPDGAVDWGNMWDTFCVLAQEGGPPHRGTVLLAQEDADRNSDIYQFALEEIIRGITEVSGLRATPSTTGWIAVECASPEMARWLAEAIAQENVQTKRLEAKFFVPVGDYFKLRGEIKNVITVVAKATHYWQAHLSQDVKRVLVMEEKLDQFKGRLKAWFAR